MTTLTTFHLFPFLPTELRLKIWTYNLPGPRIVEINYTCTSMDPSIRSYYDQPMRGCTSQAPIPSNLHTCREARDEAMKKYKLSFGLQYGRDKIFFDGVGDVLYFGTGGIDAWKQFLFVGDMVVRGEREKVRRLAVHEDVLGRTSDYMGMTRLNDFWECVRKKFEGVEEVVILRGKLAEYQMPGNSNETLPSLPPPEMETESYITHLKYFMRDSVRLESRLETALEYVARGTGWSVPKWDVMTPGGRNGWPHENLLEKRAKVCLQEMTYTQWMEHYNRTSSEVW